LLDAGFGVVELVGIEPFCFQWFPQLAESILCMVCTVCMVFIICVQPVYSKN